MYRGAPWPPVGVGPQTRVDTAVCDSGLAWEWRLNSCSAGGTWPQERAKVAPRWAVAVPRGWSPHESLRKELWGHASLAGLGQRSLLSVDHGLRPPGCGTGVPGVPALPLGV